LVFRDFNIPDKAVSEDFELIDLRGFVDFLLFKRRAGDFFTDLVGVSKDMTFIAAAAFLEGVEAGGAVMLLGTTDMT